MMVAVRPLSDQMVVVMRVCNGMDVRAAVMGMDKGVLMDMSVVPDHGVGHDKRGACQHDGKSKQVRSCQLFMQNEEG